MAASKEEFNLENLLGAQEELKSDESSDQSSDPENCTESQRVDDNFLQEDTSPDLSGNFIIQLEIPSAPPNTEPSDFKAYLEQSKMSPAAQCDSDFLKAMSLKYLKPTSEEEKSPQETGGSAETEKSSKLEASEAELEQLFKNVNRLRGQIAVDKEQLHKTSNDTHRAEEPPPLAKLNSAHFQSEPSTGSSVSEKPIISNIRGDHSQRSARLESTRFEPRIGKAYFSQQSKLPSQIPFSGSFQDKPAQGGVLLQAFQIEPAESKKDPKGQYWSPKFNSLRNSRSVDTIEKMGGGLVEKSKEIQQSQSQKRMISNWSGLNNALQRNGFSPIPLISSEDKFSLRPDTTMVQETVARLLYQIEKKMNKPSTPIAPTSSKQLMDLCQEIKRLKLDKAKLREQRNQFEEKFNREAAQRRQELIRFNKDVGKAQRGSKSMEQKVSRLEKLVKRKDMELEKLQVNYQQKEINQAKFTGNASILFEKIFGKAPRPQDGKFLKVLSSYDHMIEKLTRERNSYEKHTADMKEHIKELEDKLYVVSNGQQIPSYPGNKPTQELMDKFQRMDQQEARLKHEVRMLKQENVSLMSQIADQKGERQKYQGQINSLHQELQQRISLQQSYGLKSELKETKSELIEAKEANHHLENELMQLKNETNSHLKQRRGSFKRGSGMPLPPLSTRSTSSSHRGSSENSNPNMFDFNDIGHLSHEELKYILKQSMDLLNIKLPGQLPGAISKLEQVINAVPRMEKFIKGVCDAVLCGHPASDQQPIELVIPTLTAWRKERHEIMELNGLKVDFCNIFGVNPATTPRSNLVAQLKRLVSANQVFSSNSVSQLPQMVWCAYHSQLFSRLSEYFGTDDAAKISGNLDQLFVFTRNMRQFITRMKGFFKLQSAASVVDCLEAIHRFTEEAQSVFKVVMEVQTILGAKSLEKVVPTMRHFMQAYKSQCQLFVNK